MMYMVPAVNVADLKETTLLNMGIFGLFVAITMVIVFRASRNNKTAADYYAAGRSFTGSQNGTAIAGDYLSAASFLGITGAIAVNGYDGVLSIRDGLKHAFSLAIGSPLRGRARHCHIAPHCVNEASFYR